MPRPIHYADQFQPDFGFPWHPKLPEAELRKKSVEELKAYMDAWAKIERYNIENPVGAGFKLPVWDQVMKHWKDASIHVLLGGNQCVRGDTIISNPVSGERLRIDEIRGRHHVWAYDGLRFVIAEAEEPFPKGEDRMLRVTLSDGHSFVAAPGHVVLSANGDWLSTGQLRPGYALSRPQSTPAYDQLVRASDAKHSCEIAVDSQSGCRLGFHLCDEPPHSVLEDDQDEFPSRAYAATRRSPFDRTCRWLWRLYSHLSVGSSDAPGSTPLCSRPFGARPHRSSLGALRRLLARFAGIGFRFSCRLCKSTSRLSSNQVTWPAAPQSEPESGHRQSTSGCHQSDNLSHCASTYVTSVTEEATDVKWDMSVPAYGNYVASGVVHHNSGKTTFGARMNLWAAATIPSAETYAFHVSERRSIDDQQRFIYEALPITLKNLPTKKGIHHSLQYTQKNGFTDNIAILPPHPGYNRGGSIAFYNFQQYLQNDQIIEGIKAHFVWADELIPLPLFETLKYRLFTYHGRMLLTYTVVDGWNDTIQKIMASTKTLKTRFCDHPKIMEDLPIMQKSLSVDDCMVHFCWTQDNPFTDYKQFLKLNATANKSTLLARAFGVPTKSLVGVFPGFSQEVNVVPHADLPFIKNSAYPVSRFMALDPGGSKHWFMIWVAIDAGGTWWVYREWPDASYGEWALPGNKAGPAQEGTNLGIKDYVDIIKMSEAGEVITDRIIDPRSGAAQKQAEDGATNIISQLDEQDMVFHAAPGGSTTDGVKEIDDGLQMITDLLAYKMDKPRDAANCPRLYVSDNCPNVIFAMREYTAKLGQSEKCKESVDCLRYLRKAGCEFYNQVADRKIQRSTGVY